MRNKTKAGIVIVSLFVVPYFLFIAYFSHFGKDVVYLRGGGAAWMLNPEDDPVVDGFPHDFPAAYTTSFALGSRPDRAVLRLSAVKAHRLEVNGAGLSSEYETARENWKRPREYDIAPYLRLGGNVVSVHVRSPYSVTALKAEGEVVTAAGYTLALDSGPGWRVMSVKPFPPAGVTGGLNFPVLLSHPSFMDRLGSGVYWQGALSLFAAAFFAILILFLFPVLPRAAERTASRVVPAWAAGEKAKEFWYRASVAVVFTVLAAMLYHNFLRYPAERTGDYQSHLEYLQHFLRSFRVPLADEGFQMYNPPAFYFVSAMFYRLFGPVGALTDVVRYAQLVSTVAAFLTIAVVFLVLKRLDLGRAVTVMALAVAAFLPMSIYKAPSISAESFTALVCSLALYLWLTYLGKPGWRAALAAGLAVGFAFLSRYTALFVFLGITAGFLYHAYRMRGGERRRAVLDLGVFAWAAFAMSGWYYLRNVLHFHRPFPFNGSPELFFFRQVPGYRDWGFYTDVSGLVFNNPLSKDSVLHSFFAGTYSTMWFDGHRLFHSMRDFEPAFLALALSLLPAALIAWGAFGSAGASCSRETGDHGAFHAALLVTLSLSFAAYTLLTFKMPYYSSVKSFYMLYCIIPLVTFLALGLKSMTARSGYLTAAIWVAAFCLVNLLVYCL